MTCKLYIGTAGWYYPDWRDIVYSSKEVNSGKELDVLSNWFNCCEINSTFYAIPTSDKVKIWLNKIKDKKDFVFNIKLWQGFTHDKKIENVTLKSFKEVLHIIHKEQKLGSVLAQFPWSYKLNPDNIKRVERLISEFIEFPICIEMRNNTWNRGEFLHFLESNKVCFCNIDQPELPGNIPQTNYITSDFGYVRFHGRRKDVWFANIKTNGHIRYDYLYSKDEIIGWVEIIKDMMKKLSKIFIITNNHYRGKAVANAMQIKNLIDGSKFNIPGEMAEEYPDLCAIAENPIRKFEELELF